jgi:hydroxyacylglutathione hydrolase
MTFRLQSFILGSLENNTFVLCDEDTHQAAIIDPSFGGLSLLEKIAKDGWDLKMILVTHAHFDHYTSAVAIAKSFQPHLSIALHPDDLHLWKSGWGADYFGLKIENDLEPDCALTHGQTITLGSEKLEVRHTPGHSPGHVLFYASSLQTAFCGDLIFRRGVGRTDLPGGNYQTLVKSIRSQVFTLPPDTLLLPGHGPQTTPGEEKAENPFLS